MSWLHYLVEANIYLVVFYLCYCLFLTHETHYALSRAYLLFSCVLAFILPLIQLSILKPALQVQQVTYTAPLYTAQPPGIKFQAPAQAFTLFDALLYAYILGVVVGLAVLAYRLYSLYLLTRRGQALRNSGYKVVQLNGDNTAFSFFNYLFIGTEGSQADTIIAHELVHIRQRHSADIVFVELLKVVSWFNPFIYLLQRSLRTIHEYIADEQAASIERDRITYSAFLLNNAYGIPSSSIAHSFFNYNLLKKRIIMLNQKRSGRLARLKYLAAVPLCTAMLCTSTLVFSKNYGFIDLTPGVAKPREVLGNNVKKIKYFKITDPATHITAYSDNLSFTDRGVKKIFSAKNIKPADIEYIGDTRKLSVKVIEVDSKPDVKTPLVIMPDNDTTKRKRLPPPPPPLKPIRTSKTGLVKLPPPLIVPDAPIMPPKADAPAPPPPPPAKPGKHLKGKMPVPPKPPLAPVLKEDVKTVNIVLDTPVVFVDTKINLKAVQNVKAVTKIDMKKVRTTFNVRPKTMIINDIAPLKIEIVEPTAKEIKE